MLFRHKLPIYFVPGRIYKTTQAIKFAPFQSYTQRKCFNTLIERCSVQILTFPFRCLAFALRYYNTYVIDRSFTWEKDGELIQFKNNEITFFEYPLGGFRYFWFDLHFQSPLPLAFNTLMDTMANIYNSLSYEATFLPPGYSINFTELLPQVEDQITFLNGLYETCTRYPSHFEVYAAFIRTFHSSYFASVFTVYILCSDYYLLLIAISIFGIRVILFLTGIVFSVIIVICIFIFLMLASGGILYWKNIDIFNLAPALLKRIFIIVVLTSSLLFINSDLALTAGLIATCFIYTFDKIKNLYQRYYYFL